MLEIDSAPTASSTPSNEDANEAAAAAGQLDASVDSGDYEIPVRKSTGKHRVQTVLGVKADARKVLERFLQLTEEARNGNFMQDSSDFDNEHQYAVVGDVYRDQLPTPYQPMGSDESLYEKSQSWNEPNTFKSLPADSTAPVEPDYVDCQAFLATRAKLTGTKSHHALSLFTSSPDAKKLVEHPPKVKSSTKRSIALDEDSSSSTEDYEYTDNELINRKKKNFFRWATERLQHSFRYQGKKTTVSSGGKRGNEKQEIGTKSDVPLPLPPASAAAVCGLQRNGSEKSKSNSSSTPNDSVDQVAYRGVELETLTEEHLQKKASFTWKKSDSGKDKKRDKDAGSAPEDKGKDGRSMFDGFFRQFRRNSSKQKGKGKQRSRSADTCTIRHLTSDELKIAQRCAALRVPSECDSDTATSRARSRTKDTSTMDGPVPVLLSDLRLTGHQSNVGSPRMSGRRSNVGSPRLSGRLSNVGSPKLQRSKMNLDGLVSCRPQMPTPPGMETLASLSDSYRRYPRTADTLDGDLLDIEAMLIHKSSKSFADKPEHEKEELYERIAEQLAAIADRLNLESPRSFKSSGPDDDKSVQAVAVSGAVEDDVKYAASLETVIPRPTGDCAVTAMSVESPATPVVAELVHNARDNDVRRFQQLVSDNVGSETGWQAIARMFRLTQSAVQMAGMGTNVAIQIKEMTLNYFEDRFADWIVGQGGWESMVEETNTELDSEVD